MKCKRWICALLTLVCLYSGFTALGEETKEIIGLLADFMNGQAVDAFEVLEDPESKLICVNTSVDGVAEMMKNGGAAAETIRQSFSQAYDEMVALVKETKGINLEKRLLYQMIDDGWFLHGGETADKLVLMARCGDQWFSSGEDGLLKPEEIPVIAPADTNSDVQGSVRYVLNLNSRKFHKLGCSSVDQIKDKNKGYHYGTRDEAILAGYVPCKNCNP